MDALKDCCRMNREDSKQLPRILMVGCSGIVDGQQRVVLSGLPMCFVAAEAKSKIFPHRVVTCDAGLQSNRMPVGVTM